MSARRGWRERVEPGLYRAHRVACRSTADHRPGRRCGCPWQVAAPGVKPGSTRLVTVTGSIGEARAERRRLLAAGRPELETEVAPGTVTEFAAAWFRAKAAVWAPNTLRNREDDFLRRIEPPLGEVELSALTRERVEVWLADLIAGSSSRRMVVQTVSTLRAMLAAAVEWGRLSENPAARLRLPKAHPDERTRAARRVVGIDQLRALFAAAGGARTETLLRAAGEVGMRRGEIIGLRWGDVDLAARRITIRRQVVQVPKPGGGHEKVVSAPKSGRESTVAMSAALARRLADWYAESVVEGGADAQGYVWPGTDGGPMHNRSLARALERACARVGLVDEAGRPLLSPHRLRHSAASVMLAEGVPLPVVSAQLTHASPRITSQVYSHMVGDDLDRAAAVFDAPTGPEGDRDIAGDVAGAGGPGATPLPVRDRG